MKEAMTKVIDMNTQEDFHGAFEKLLERCSKCIAAGGDNFEGYKIFINKSAHMKKIWKLIVCSSYIHFQTNTLKKGMEPLLLKAMG